MCREVEGLDFKILSISWSSGMKRQFDCETLWDISVGIMNTHLSMLSPVVPVNSVDMFHKLKDELYLGLAESDRF